MTRKSTSIDHPSQGAFCLTYATSFHEALERCTSEAARLFGSAHCLIEKYIQAGKHVEIQIFGDGDKAVSFLDRECSVQRRNQKVIEESPCPWLSPALRQEMSSAGLEIAKLLKYKSAGTVEFIVVSNVPHTSIGPNPRG